MHAKDITQKFERIDARVDARMDARIDCRIDYRPFFDSRCVFWFSADGAGESRADR